MDDQQHRKKGFIMQIPGPSFRAGGTIAPFRAVTMDTSNDNQVVQATANSIVIGIAQEGQKGAPGVAGSDTTIAAVNGDPIEVIAAVNVALVEVGSTVTRGDRLEADANGRLITSVTSGQRNIAGIALESGSASGVRIKMQVLPHQITN
jgi:hypothetical protein